MATKRIVVGVFDEANPNIAGAKILYAVDKKKFAYVTKGGETSFFDFPEYLKWKRHIIFNPGTEDYMDRLARAWLLAKKEEEKRKEEELRALELNSSATPSHLAQPPVALTKREAKAQAKAQAAAVKAAGKEAKRLNKLVRKGKITAEQAEAIAAEQGIPEILGGGGVVGGVAGGVGGAAGSKGSGAAGGKGSGKGSASPNATDERDEIEIERSAYSTNAGSKGEVRAVKDPTRKLGVFFAVVFAVALVLVAARMFLPRLIMSVPELAGVLGPYVAWMV